MSFRVLTVAFAVLTLAVGAHAELEPTDVTFQSLMSRASVGTKARNARVEFEQGANFMGIPVRGTGVALYRPPGSNRTAFEMQTPVGPITSTLISGPGGTWQITDSRMGKKAVKIAADDPMAALNLDPFSAFAGLNAEEFGAFVDARFEVTVPGIDRSADPDVYVIDLRNRDQNAPGPAHRITVRVGVEDAFPRQMEIFGPEADLVGHLTVTGVELGLDLPDSTFLYVPGPDVDVEDRTKPPASSSGWEGRAAPTFALPSLAGTETSLSSFQGSYVIVDFWATWCAPCRKAMPVLETLHQSVKGLKVLAINTENQERADTYIKDAGYTFTTLVDQAQAVSRAYGVTGIPTTFIIDPQGIVAKRLVGYHPEAQVRAALREAGMRLE